VSLPEPSALVPHRGDALLLDCIDAVRPDGLVASLIVCGGRPSGGERRSLPAWMGPEIMAQAISAFATYRSGPPYHPKPGLILGIRKYHSSVTEFNHGTRLAVSVRESTRDDAGGAVFDSTLCMNGAEIATGMLTVYQTDNIVLTLADQFE
jgi:predicted hotdog family 3-hydroxylacyl-ACP dehydratase